MGLLDNTLNSVYFIVDGYSMCPFVVTTHDHVKMIPINTSVTPPTYGKANIITSQNCKFSQQHYNTMRIKGHSFVQHIRQCSSLVRISFIQFSNITLGWHHLLAIINCTITRQLLLLVVPLHVNYYY